MRVLAVDPGTVRVGLALSDETETLATALDDLRGGPGLPRAIAELASARDAGKILIGLPLNMDGSQGPAAAAARQLADEVRHLTWLPVEMWDERLTTVQAQRPPDRQVRPGRQVRAGASRRTRHGAVDARAAALLLQSYLDRRKD